MKGVRGMMAGLVEFVYRLLNPIEEKSPRMYHFDVALWAINRNACYCHSYAINLPLLVKVYI